jgi:16S rRNA (guanine527-N7)-methyltransferase
LAAVPPLQRHLGGRAARLLDVGSGAGLPGTVIAALCPAIVVTCVEPVGKKAAFVRQVAAELQLPNLVVEQGRVELGTGRFDIVMSRAFASLKDFTSLTRERIDRDGVWVAMKGRRPDDEIASLPETVRVFHVEQLTVPGLQAERCLVWMRPGDPLSPP